MDGVSHLVSRADDLWRAACDVTRRYFCEEAGEMSEMSDYESDTSEVTDGSCIFCSIATGQDKEAVIMKKVCPYYTK